jgi:secondary thiamine-phosphate synthase enzyme
MLPIAQYPEPLDTQMMLGTNAHFTVFHQSIHLQTEAGLQFVDLTEAIRSIVTQSGVEDGIVNIQTCHTTTAVIVNEHEPLLLEDMRRVLARVVPQHDYYLHNDFEIRTVNMTPDECPNGHAHCQALFLNSAVTLNILQGELQLGQWQRIFFIELDHARSRTASVMVMGQAVDHSYDWTRPR